MKLKFLDWDSNFFNKKIGELIYEPSQYVSEDTCNYDLIYVTSYEEFQLEISNYNCTFSEAKVIFEKKISNTLLINNNISSFIFTENGLLELYDLAFESGKFSRFKLDKKFSETDFKNLYKLWVDNSLNNSFANEVLVFEQNNKIKGFVTYSTTADDAKIGLIAVSSHYQGMGIGKMLINEVERKIKEEGINTLLIPTQLENKPACNFYTKLGYQIKEIIYLKHYWKL